MTDRDQTPMTKAFGASGAAERLAAVREMNDYDALTRVASESDEEAIRDAAIERLSQLQEVRDAPPAADVSVQNPTSARKTISLDYREIELSLIALKDDRSQEALATLHGLFEALKSSRKSSDISQCGHVAGELTKRGDVPAAEWLMAQGAQSILSNANNILGSVDLSNLPIEIVRRLTGFQAAYWEDVPGAQRELRDARGVQKNAGMALKKLESQEVHLRKAPGTTNVQRTETLLGEGWQVVRKVVNAEAVDEEAARRRRESQIRETMRRRARRNQCVNCGRPLSWLVSIFHKSHIRCKEFVP